jgi:hypothetical protein
VSALLDSNAKYRDVLVFEVNWDRHRGSAVTKDLGVGRRSTLVMFKSGKEIGRVVSRVDAKSIGNLFELATS